MAPITRRFRPSLISLATAYADQADDELVIPDDLTALSDEDLAALATRAGEAFDTLYGDGSADFNADDLATLASLTEAIEVLAVERTRRDDEAGDRRTQADALAARRNATLSAEADADGGDDDDAAGDDEDEDDADEDGDADEDADASVEAAVEEPVLASGPTTINLASTRRRQPQRRTPAPAERSMRDIAFATTDVLGFADRAPLTWADAGKMVDKRLASFALGQYQAAKARGQHIREQHSLMAIRRDIPKELVAGGTPELVDAAIKRAVDMKRLPGGALTAAGWCAPSEVSYDLCFSGSRDGLLSIPEVGISRGGIRVPVTPSWAALYDDVGFHFTEADAIAGNWAPGANPGDPNVPGNKPCYEIECPTWVDYRLEGDGVCIVGDLLSVRGYPEALAWTTEGALVAHDHKVSAGRIAKIVAGSTAITMPAGQAGAAAPVLSAIELQTEHYRYARRLARSTVLEAVLPYWIRGAIRQDLSVRLGLAFFDVTDAMIDAWFRLRGVVPQYVYDWQVLTNGQGYPDTVQFLLYEAGTWVGGVDDIITVDTLYDSTLLGENKFTALFTEEAWLVAKRCEDSRVITVDICPDGATHAGLLLECDLTETPATP